MPTTRYKISEQVMELLKGSNPKSASTVKIESVIEYAGQVINKLFKQEHITVNIPSGESIPQGVMLTYYDGLVPVQYKNVSKITLPATPVALPRNLGVFHVSRTADINNGFVPVLNGQTALLTSENLMNSIITDTYSVYGNDIIFNKDLTTENGTTIIVGLLVHDINSFDDYTALPLPSDMEADVVQECFKLFASQLPQATIDDPSTERSPQKSNA